MKKQQAKTVLCEDEYERIVNNKATALAAEIVKEINSTAEVLNSKITDYCDNAIMDVGVDALYNRKYALEILHDKFRDYRAPDYLLAVVEESIDELDGEIVRIEMAQDEWQMQIAKGWVEF